MSSLLTSTTIREEEVNLIPELVESESVTVGSDNTDQSLPGLNRKEQEQQRDREPEQLAEPLKAKEVEYKDTVTEDLKTASTTATALIQRAFAAGAGVNSVTVGRKLSSLGNKRMVSQRKHKVAIVGSGNW